MITLNQVRLLLAFAHAQRTQNHQHTTADHRYSVDLFPAQNVEVHLRSAYCFHVHCLALSAADAVDEQAQGAKSAQHRLHRDHHRGLYQVDWRTAAVLKP